MNWPLWGPIRICVQLFTATRRPVQCKLRYRIFVFGCYKATSAKTSFVEEAGNIVRMPRDLTDDRSDEGIYRFA